MAKNKKDPLNIIGKSLDNGIVTFEEFLGEGGLCVVYRSRPNFARMIGNRMLRGEEDPGMFGLDIPFSEGKEITDKRQRKLIVDASVRYSRLYEGLSEEKRARIEKEAMKRIRDDFRGTDVAVKMLRSSYTENEQIAKRFLREARGLRKFRHPNIVRCIDYGFDEKSRIYYYLMEYVPNEIGLEHIGVINPKAAVKIGIRLLRALKYGHDWTDEEGNSKPVVHRDIKPGNILVDGNTLYTTLGVETDEWSEIAFEVADDPDVRVTDFGFAKIALPGEETLTRTADDAIVGTPAYMSPWQAEGPQNPEPAWDIWSASSTMYRLLTGKNTYGGKSIEIVKKLLKKELPPDMRFHNPKVHKRLAEVVMRGFRTNIDHMPTAEEYLMALEEVEAEELYEEPEIRRTQVTMVDSEMKKELMIFKRETSRFLKKAESGTDVSGDNLQEMEAALEQYWELVSGEDVGSDARLGVLRSRVRLYKAAGDKTKAGIAEKDLAWEEYVRTEREMKLGGSTVHTSKIRTAAGLTIALGAAGLLAFGALVGGLKYRSYREYKDAETAFKQAVVMAESGKLDEARAILKALSYEDFQDDKAALEKEINDRDADRLYTMARGLLDESKESKEPEALITKAIDIFERAVDLDPTPENERKTQTKDIEKRIFQFRQDRKIYREIILPGLETYSENYGELLKSVEEGKYPEKGRLSALERNIKNLSEMLEYNIQPTSIGGENIHEEKSRELAGLKEKIRKLRKESADRQYDAARKLMDEAEKMLYSEGFESDFLGNSKKIEETAKRIKKIAANIDPEMLMGGRRMKAVSPDMLSSKLSGRQDEVAESLYTGLEKDIGAIDPTDPKGPDKLEEIKKRAERLKTMIGVIKGRKTDDIDVEGVYRKLERTEKEVKHYRSLLLLAGSDSPDDVVKGVSELIDYHFRRNEYRKVKAFLSKVEEDMRTPRMKKFGEYFQTLKDRDNPENYVRQTPYGPSRLDAEKVEEFGRLLENYQPDDESATKAVTGMLDYLGSEKIDTKKARGALESYRSIRSELTALEESPPGKEPEEGEIEEYRSRLKELTEEAAGARKAAEDALDSIYRSARDVLEKYPLGPDPGMVERVRELEAELGK